MAADVRELYERLLSVSEEATRYRALAEVSESTRAADAEHFAAEVARLQHERDEARENASAAEEAAAAERAKAAEVAAELERVKSRGFLARVFGGNG